MRKKLSDLDAKLKSMRGNSAQRNPRFDSAMANQNFKNSMAEQRARIDAERRTSERPFKLQIPRPPTSQPSPELGTQGVDPRAPQYGFDKSKRKSGKEILLSFAGGQYGSINDEAANAIAKKYNLEIFSKPNPNRDEGPRVYGFSVKGNVDKGLSGIRNEPGIRYVEANSRGFSSERGPDPFITYEDNRMRAALNGEELPAPPVGYVEGFDRSKKTPRPSPEIGGMGGQGPQRDPNTGMTFQEMMNSQLGQGQFTQGRLMGAPTNRPIPRGGGLGGLTADQAGIPEDQRKILDDLMARQAQQPIPLGGGMGGSIGAPENMQSPNMPQGQIATYNNLLQQGIQRSNTMNQDAATNFANMQAGAPTTQPTIPLPQLGGVTAQPRNLPRPRQPKGFGSPIGRSAF